MVWTELRIPIFGANLGETFWGLYSLDKFCNPFIVYSTSHQFDQRNVFTIAHELGHHVFDHGETIVETDENRDSLREKRADAFAQELLVPIDALRRHFDEIGLSLARPLRPAHVVKLCEYFRVSFLMMSYCLLQAGKITSREFSQFKNFCLTELASQKSELSYHPETYLVRRTSLQDLLREVISVGLRKSIISKLEASKMLDITPTEAARLA